MTTPSLPQRLRLRGLLRICSFGRPAPRRQAIRPLSRRSSFEVLEPRTLLAGDAALPELVLIGPRAAATAAPAMATVTAATVQPAAATTVSWSRTFTTRRSIPDGPTGAWVGWDIDARALPADAYITSIKVRHKATHSRIGDLQAVLYNDTGTTWTIRSNTGGTAKNFDETKTDTTVLVGAAARQVWHYRIRDTVRLKTGTLDRLEVTLTYRVLPVQILDTTLSAATARDGQTLTLGYKISSTTEATVTLGAALIPPGGGGWDDPAHNVQVRVTPGTNWYYRTLPINLGPQPAFGAYGVRWEVSGGPGGTTALTRSQVLTIQEPLPVRVPILMYHHINDGPEVDGVSPAMFRAQLEALRAYGYTTVTLQELMGFRAGVAVPPAKPVLITFDDGYADLYTTAFPILSDPALQAKATAFIFTEGVETDPAIVTWPQLRALEGSGLVEIESHTVSHPHLTQLTSAQRTAELVNAKATLESQLSKEIRYVSYPYGDYDATILQAAWAAGYAGGVAAWGGVESTSANKFALSRVGIVRATSVDYDLAHPQDFFFTALADPDLVVPQLTILSLQYRDATTGQAVSQVAPGQTVQVRATVTNSGPTAAVVATLRLDADSDRANGIAFDSHTAVPRQDLGRVFAAGTQEFEWTWQVPSTATSGQYYAQVKFLDERYVLGFCDSGWQAALTISPSAASPAPLWLPSPSPTSGSNPATVSATPAIPAATTLPVRAVAVLARTTPPPRTSAVPSSPPKTVVRPAELDTAEILAGLWTSLGRSVETGAAW